MKICIDSDNSGCGLGRDLEWILRTICGHEVENFWEMNRPYGYPVIATGLAKRIASGEFERGILICSTGLGMAMAACKVRGIYAGTPQNVAAARKMAESNNAQVITIGADITHPNLAKEMVLEWVKSRFADRGNAKIMRDLEAAQ